MSPELRVITNPDPIVPDRRIEALRAGDRAATAEVLRELLPFVRRWLHRLLGPRSDLDDATQDALTEIARALPRYEGRASLKTLSHRITVRTAYRYYGRKNPRELLSLVPPALDDADPESKAMSREALARLHRCLERLPERRRVAFVLCAIEGMTPQEAAELEGVSPVAMRSRLMHARAEIERRLSADPYVVALIGGRDEE